MSGITLLRDGGVAVVTLDSVETRNSITSSEMLDAIDATFGEIARAHDVRAVVLTGAGTSFSSGGNIKKLQSLSQLADAQREVTPLEAIDKYRNGVQRIPKALRQVEVPIIAAVNGPAIGAGCDLALMCDIRLAARSARFAESFVKLGILSGTGGAWLLPRVVGASKAFEMALTGDPISADEALQFGLISAVYEDDKLLPASIEMAQRIAANPSYAVRMTKSLMRRALSVDYDTVLEAVASAQVLAAKSSEHKEAVKALSSKLKGNKT